MKKCFLVLVFCGFGYTLSAQAHEVQQLLLNWEKLAQLKSILDKMYEGYQVVHNGYTAIRDISSGNFRLHKGFLDSLLLVSPAVKNYKKVADIVSCQARIMQEYKKAFAYFRATGSFTPAEINHIEGVYRNLVRQSLKNLDELLLVVTSGQLRMSDAERLDAVDRVFADMQEKLFFLRTFNNSNKILAVQRQRERAEGELAKKIYGLK